MCVEANFLPGGPSSKIYPMIFYDIPFHTGPIPDLVGEPFLYVHVISCYTIPPNDCFADAKRWCP